MNNRPGIIPVFIPHVGCPHDCVFCNQRKISGQQNAMDMDRLRGHIEQWLGYLGEKRKRIEIAFYGGSFTGIPVSQQDMYLHMARRYVNGGRVHGIRLSTRPDYLDQETVDRLLEYGVTTVEIGVQSLSERVLVASGRGHGASVVNPAVKRLRQAGIQTGVQLMIGLPGENDEDLEHTTEKTIDLRPDFVRIYPVVVVEDTNLATQFERQQYEPLSIDQAVEKSARMRMQLIKAGIPVIRIGLQPTEDLLEGAVLGGPLHSAMGELVISEGLYQSITACLQTVDMSQIETRTLEITCHPANRSKVIGQKKRTLCKIQEENELDQIVVTTDERWPKERVTLKLGTSEKICTIYP